MSGQSVGNNAVAIATTFFSSFLAFYFAKDFLSRITNNDVLWVIFFLELFVLFTLIQMGYSYVYKPTKSDDNGEAFRSRQLLLIFLQVTPLLTALRFLTSLVMYGMSITAMTLLLYFVVLVLGLTFIFVVIYKLQVQLE
jgi:hypothetical protein